MEKEQIFVIDSIAATPDYLVAHEPWLNDTEARANISHISRLIELSLRQRSQVVQEPTYTKVPSCSLPATMDIDYASIS